MARLSTCKHELKTHSFYGSATKISISSGSSGTYLTPLERKSLRERSMKSDVRLETMKPMQKRRKSTTQKENAAPKQKLKAGTLGSISFKKVEDTESGTRKQCSTKSQSSPTINWKPNSLKDKYSRMAKTKYANIAKKANTKTGQSMNKQRAVQVLGTVSTNSPEAKCGDEKADVPDPDDHFQFSVQSPIESHEEKSTKYLKKVQFSQESTDSTDSGVRTEEPELSSSTDEAKALTDVATKKRLHPIFSPQLNQKTTPTRKSSRLLSKKTAEDMVVTSPETKTISLPGTTKSRQCSSPTTNSPASKQLIIDAGQKAFGATLCKVCGMVYTVNHPEDQQMHKIHHNRFVSCMRFPGWKKERVVSTFMNGRIIKVLPSDPKFALNKVEEIGSVIDSELGFNRMSVASNLRPLVTYLYIADDNQIAGCLICEPITQAYRLLPTEKDPSPLSCETEPRPATCGVSRIWTCSRFRRQGIATRLCDVMRRSFVIGSQLELDQIAFSHPSPAGRSFASKYCGTQQFLTYNFVQ